MKLGCSDCCWQKNNNLSVVCGRCIKTHLIKLSLCIQSYLFVLEQPASAQPNPTGTWEVIGRDTSGTTWKATLVLQPTDVESYPPKTFEGHFDWEGSNQTGGREYVLAATYDYDTRHLEMRGGELEDADPNIRTSIYTVNMSEGADRLLNGTWHSSGVTPGIWQAERSGAKPQSKRKASASGRVKMPATEGCPGGLCPLTEDRFRQRSGPAHATDGVMAR